MSRSVYLKIVKLCPHVSQEPETLGTCAYGRLGINWLEIFSTRTGQGYFRGCFETVQLFSKAR